LQRRRRDDAGTHPSVGYADISPSRGEMGEAAPVCPYSGDGRAKSALFKYEV